MARSVARALGLHQELSETVAFAHDLGHPPFGHNGERDSVVIDAMRYATDGWREHSSAQRNQFNAKWQGDLSRDTRVSVVVNGLDQPDSLDPLGLTRAQFDANPQQAVAIARAPSTLRSAEIWTVRLFSSTTRPGQTASSNSSFETTRSRRSISATSRSNARAPTLAGTPATVSARSAGLTSTLPNR